MKRIILALILVFSVIGCTASVNTNVIADVNSSIIEMPQVPLEEQSSPSEPVVEEITEEVEEAVEEISEVVSPASASNTSAGSSKFMQEGRCTDSDVTEEFPNGINLGLKGAILINGVAIKNGADYCTNTVRVSEWYCQNGVSRVQVYSCPGKCTAGACE